jgi:hypothetical protein
MKGTEVRAGAANIFLVGIQAGGPPGRAAEIDP